MSEPTSSTARFRATIEYDGTGFHGSQLQPDVRTVQGEVEAALSKLLDRATRVDLSGRTDAGVHAAAQEIAFAAPARWEVAELLRALRAVLPDDVGVAQLSETGAEFHPRFDATARRYEYLVAGSSEGGVFVRDRAWLFGRAGRDEASGGLVSVERAGKVAERAGKLAERTGELAERTGRLVEHLGKLAERFVGERSFESFAKAGQPERGSQCRIESAAWRQLQPSLFSFEITADRFLHHMVRYIVGTCLEIASGARPESDLEELLENRRASRAVFPAPPSGLYLTGVRYDGVWNRNPGIPWLSGIGRPVESVGEETGRRAG